MSEFVVITGLSGAGRSQAANNLEDLGWFVIDNLPPSLMPKVAELGLSPGTAVENIALVVGTGPYHEEVLPALEALARSAGRVRTLYLEASTDVLVRRYESTRRRHPLMSDTLAGAIEAERQLLAPVRAMADVVVDTSDLNVHQLRDRIVDLFRDSADDGPMRVTVTSFGYKHGLPLDVDLVIDCRFLPNPHWVESLRPLTGLDDEVRKYLFEQEVAGPFIDRLSHLLELLVPAYEAEGKAYLTIALGCTGGRHRSVAVAEAMAESLRSMGVDPSVIHRDVEREP